MTAFKQKLVTAVVGAMAGRKCDCEGCNCHYGEADAEKLVSAIAPIVADECAKEVHDDLLARLRLHA